MTIPNGTNSICVCDALLVPPDAPHDRRVLIENVKVFDGEDPTLITGMNVVLKGNVIEGLVPADADEEGYEAVIDGKGGYLTPGLVDIHYHSWLALPVGKLLTKPVSYVTAITVRELEKVLKRGVTTVRDPAGDVFGVKMAIEDGEILGPRIYPAGAMLSQYSGHGDYRNVHDGTRELGGKPISLAEQVGFTYLCNGVDEVLKATRHQLYLGATQIKMAISGGVGSFTDPLYVNEFLPEEIEIACRAAADYGTYVMVHCHNSAAVQRALKAGVRSFDHISQIDEETTKMLADAGVSASLQVKVMSDIYETYSHEDVRWAKAKQCLEHTAKVFEWSKEYGLRLSWGTDLMDSEELRDKQLEDLALRTKYGFTPAELMVQATGNGGKTVGMCGSRNPYGPVGVIKPGAMADILIYNKNPLEDINVVVNFEETLDFIMKDGEFVKNAVDQ